MRILHINCNYIYTTLHQKMIENLDALGIENKVYVPVSESSSDDGVITPNSNAKVIKCFKKIDRLFFDFKQIKIYKALKQNYSANEFDCVHAYTLFTDGNCALKLKKEYGVPYVVAVRNTDVNTFFKYMIHLRKRGIEILRNASSIFFLSEAYKRFVIDKYVPVKFQDEILRKSHIIPNGIDEYWLKNVHFKQNKDIIQRIKNDGLRLIYAGAVDKNKNLTLTAQAVEKLIANQYNVTFTSVGKVVDDAIYQQLYQKSYFEYVPAKPKEELINFYRGSDIFVMPSHNETFGLVYAEAMSQGLPVIYTRGQGFDGHFPDGVVGYAVDDNSAGDLCAKIELIIENYDKISRNCTEMASKFDWKTIVKFYEKIYCEIIEKTTL